MDADKNLCNNYQTFIIIPPSSLYCIELPSFVWFDIVVESTFVLYYCHRTLFYDIVFENPFHYLTHPILTEKLRYYDMWGMGMAWLGEIVVYHPLVT